MTLCLLLAALALPARAGRLVDDPRLAAAIKSVRKAGGRLDADDFKDRAESAAKEARRVHGCVVAGKISLDGPGDPDAISAQMVVQPGGYFVDAYDPTGRPLGFRAPGYEALDVTPECKDELVWLELSMKPAPQERLGGVIARVEPSAARATVYPALAPTNVDGAGVDAHRACMKGERCASIPAPRVSVDANGVLVSTGLAPIEHGLSLSAPGYVATYSTFAVVPGETRDLGILTLEKAKRLTIRFLTAPKPPFKGAPKTTTATTEEPWSSVGKSGKRWWQELAFQQKDGQVFVTPATGPADIADLGPGVLEDFAARVSESSIPPDAPFSVPLVEGHVYVLHEKYYKRWLLLTAKIEP